MEKKKFNIINLIIIFAGLFLIFMSVYLINQESSKAKVFCNSVNKTYVLSILNLSHTCNGEVIKEYSFGWEFESNLDKMDKVNLSMLDKLP